MATITSNTAFKNALLDGSVTIASMFNGGSLTIRTGTAPGASNPATGTVLVTFATTNTTWAAAANGQKALVATLVDPTADNTGVAGYFRLSSSSGTYVLEGDVTATGGGGAMELVTTNIYAGQPVDLTQFTFVLSHS